MSRCDRPTRGRECTSFIISLVVAKYTTTDELFVEINGTGMFNIGNIFMIMLTPITVRFMT